MSSPSLRPLIDTCQKCSSSPANHEPRSPANGSFQNPGVCPQAVPSFPSPTPTVLFLALAPFSAQAKYRKPRSSVFLCSQTLRKRLLRRLYKCLRDQGPEYLSEFFNVLNVNYNLRGASTRLMLPSFNLEYMHKSWSYLTTKLWNSL